MKKVFMLIFFAIFINGTICLNSARRDSTEDSLVPLSEQTEECLECHRSTSPGIVEDWLFGSHAHSTPAQAIKKSKLERAISNEDIPEHLQNVAVGCYECHSLNPEKHQDNFEHFDHTINVVVSPDDCAICHSEEREQYGHSKKAYALWNLEKNPVYHTLVETITSLKQIQDGKITQLDSSYNSKAETCYACHGTEVAVKGTKAIETDFDEIQVPVLTNWPNQGVGRANPDGSMGACTACHPRHSFSVAIARKPETCSQCHLEPDLPAWNVYRESKHGNIYYSKKDEWNWTNIPWILGKDFKAPTCAGCHNSLVINPDGYVIAERSHDFGNRLWVRIFGLITSHPQPRDGRTYTIKNKDGLPLPTTFAGVLASDHLLGKEAQDANFQKMKKVCTSCHSTDWTQGHFSKFQITLKETDAMVLAATQLLVDAWNKGLADPSNPFDEIIEHKWLEQWLFYANSVRYGSAMSGPDYAAFKNGWWKLTKNLEDMQHFIH
jgi:hydroxylamine dehydrogenase